MSNGESGVRTLREEEREMKREKLMSEARACNVSNPAIERQRQEELELRASPTESGVLWATGGLHERLCLRGREGSVLAISI